MSSVLRKKIAQQQEEAQQSNAYRSLSSPLIHPFCGARWNEGRSGLEARDESLLVGREDDILCLSRRTSVLIQVRITDAFETTLLSISLSEMAAVGLYNARFRAGG